MGTTIEEKKALATFWMWKLSEHYKKVIHDSSFHARCRGKSIVLPVGSTAIRGNDREGLFRFY